MRNWRWGTYPLTWTCVVIAVLAASLIVGAVLAAFSGNWESAFLSGVAAALILAPFVLRSKFDIYLPTAFSVFIAIFVYATLVLGELEDYYERFWWWDMVLHSGTAVAFGLIGLTLILLFFKKKRVSGNPLVLAVFSFCFALSIGALWEIYEFGLDQLFGLNTQKSGLPDTMTDLIVDAAGALIAGVIAFFYMRPGVSTPFEKLIRKTVEKNHSS